MLKTLIKKIKEIQGQKSKCLFNEVMQGNFKNYNELTGRRFLNNKVSK